MFDSGQLGKGYLRRWEVNSLIRQKKPFKRMRLETVFIQYPESHSAMEDKQAAEYLDLVISCVRYRSGLGGFSLARPHLYTGPGGYLSGNPRPPLRGQPILIPWMGPHFLRPIFNGHPSGVWVGQWPERGQGPRMPQKTPCPRPLSGAGPRKGPVAHVFRGPVCPVMNSRWF